jgi:hypothetical protein
MFNRRANTFCPIAVRTLRALLLCAVFTLSLMAAADQAPVFLGAAANFSVLAGSTVTSTGATQVTGDLGVSPGTAVTGFPPGNVHGTIHAGDPAAAQAIADLTTAFDDAAGRPAGPVIVAGNLGGRTLTPGVYASTSSLAISSGDLTLDALGNASAVFIFQMASTLTTTTGRQVILAGGAQAANIFWQVGSSATLGAGSVFKGTIMADQSVALDTGATLDGRALARIAGVTLQANVITKPAGGIIIGATLAGSMAQLASGGGWDTTITLANAGTSSAQVQLSFFDNVGNPLPLPLTFVQTGDTSAASSTVNRTIAAGATLVILTQGENSVTQVGWAQLTTDGNVGGFAIFHSKYTDQECVVPLETRNASAYVLAFDNTNGAETGLALANASNQAASVPVILRNDAGVIVGTATINLAGLGHTSFMLGDNFTVVAGKRGSVEFRTPAGTQISAIGIRATKASALTTIPVLVK